MHLHFLGHLDSVDSFIASVRRNKPQPQLLRIQFLCKKLWAIMRRRQKKRQLSCYNNQWLPGKVFFKLGRVANQKLLGRVLHVSLTWAPPRQSIATSIAGQDLHRGKRFILPLFQYLVWQTLIFLNKNDGFHCSAAQNGKFNCQNHDSISMFCGSMLLYEESL